VIFNIKKKIQNAQIMPKIYYGLHMTEGVAEYRDVNYNAGEPYRILVLEKAIKEMDPTFAGVPLYVGHVDDVDPEKNVENADGYVIDSFFNKSDGKHWCKFIAISDAAHDAIAKGWQLSNAYRITQAGAGGKWHAVDYAQEVLAGQGEHIAVVQDPRYSESIILTPEKFKEYNAKKEGELLKLANSTKETKKIKPISKGDTSMFNFFKNEKVENSDELANMSVVLPKSKKTVTLSNIINEADKAEVDKDKEKMSNGDEMVEIDDKKMSVNEMVEELQNFRKKKNEDDKKAAEDEKQNKKNMEDADHKIMENMDDEDKEKYQNMSDEDKEEFKNMMDKEEKKENEEEDEKENEEDDIEVLNKKKKNSNFEDLKNAHIKNAAPVRTLEIGADKIARGKSRYGS